MRIAHTGVEAGPLQGASTAFEPLYKEFSQIAVRANKEIQAQKAKGEFNKIGQIIGEAIGQGIGLAFGSRVLAALAIFSALVALIPIAFDEFHRRRDAWQRLTRFVWLLLPALLIGYSLMGLLWPWSVTSPLNPLKASDYFSGFFEKPWRELYGGRLVSVPDMPASYLPHMFAIKLPGKFWHALL